MNVILALAVLLLAVPAAADSKIVLESFTGGKTDEAARLIAPLLEALANRGFLGGYEALGRTFEGRVSRPAIQRGLPADFAAQVEAGHRAWIGGKFEEAVKILAPVADAAFANSGAFAKNQDARELLFKALVALALAHQRMGDPAAMRQTFEEVLRCFPNTAPQRATYGAEAVEAFEKVKREHAARGRGKLVVRTSVDSAVIYINEKIEAAGTATRENLLPGEYRVFAQLGKHLSRTHRVTVRANETATVTIDADFDLALQTTPTWTGFAFSTSTDRERSEVAHAAQFGNALGADAVAVVGIDQVRGRPAIVGVLVNRISSTEIRRASVSLEPAPSAERLKALAEFLAGANLNPEGIDVLVSNEQPVVPRGNAGSGGSRIDPPPRGSGGWKFVAGGLGLAALGTGAVLLVLDGNCRTEAASGMLCDDVWATATPGYVALGGGAALTALSVYMFVKRSDSSRTAFITPRGDGVLAGITGRW